MKSLVDSISCVSKWHRNCGEHADLFYQGSAVSQISQVTASKKEKIPGPSFLYVLSKTACAFSRIHANTNNVLFQSASS